jgi:5-methylcytosine-specific restriction endonuclease McrA
VTRAEYLRGYIKAWRAARRAQLIEMLGGCCMRCGAVEDLEFDHIDPITKRFAVGASLSRAWAELVEEALKCQLSCRPCHIDKGAERSSRACSRLLPILVLRLPVRRMHGSQRGQERQATSATHHE